MEKPKINYQFWLDKWHEEIGNSKVRNVSYSSFRGTLHECEEKILEIVKSPDLTELMILQAIDLINQWGGSESRHFYIDKKRKCFNNEIVLKNPRKLIAHPENLLIYKRGIEQAKKHQIESVNTFLKVFGIGPSYMGKHAYFWSELNLVIIDAKIAGCLGYKSSQNLLNKNSYESVIEFLNSIKEEEKLNHITDVEKAMFAFHRNFFKNNNLGFKSSFKYNSDLKFAIELANILSISTPLDLDFDNSQEIDFVKHMEKLNLKNEFIKILKWSSSDKFPLHEKVYSSKTNRISFRLPGGAKAFLTIMLMVDDLKYLLNGVGVDMNDMKNWRKADYSILMSEEFVGEVKLNYRKRKD